MLRSERTIALRRARLIVVGEGRAGKTALVRALSNLDFEDTDSTAGIETSTVQTTDLRDWVKLDGTECDKVLSCV